MTFTMTRTTIVAGMLLAGFMTMVSATAQTPLGSSFTYQGKLDLAGAPVNDTADFEFTLWDDPNAGNMVSSTLAVNNLTVVDGLFTVELDFGIMAFNGDARWLEVSVASPSGGLFTTLTPRQPLTAAPYAQFALNTLADPNADTHSLDAVDGAPVDALFVDATGQVGIGVTNPSAVLQVAGTIVSGEAGETDGEIVLEDSGGIVNNPSIFTNPDGDLVLQAHSTPGIIAFRTGNPELLRAVIDPEGEVGIGVVAPQYPLHLNRDGTAVDSFPGATPSQQAQVQLLVNGTGVTGGGLAISDNGGFFDLNDGYITYLPLATGMGLRVQGSFRVVNNAWPDYVFDADYDLKSLNEIEAHIAKHGHLPDVPSAKQVHAEGIDVSEMNAVLLRKIEELTLHMIAQQKEIERLKAQVSAK